MKAECKSKPSRTIHELLVLPWVVPFKFLMAWALFIGSFFEKPHRHIYDEFGIRVFTTEENDKSRYDCAKVYTALELLNRHDKVALELIKRHIRIIYLWTNEANGSIARWRQQSNCSYMGAGICILNLRRFPVDFSTGRRAVNIIELLVFEASKIKFAGMFGAYFPLKREDRDRCTEESRKAVRQFFQ